MFEVIKPEAFMLAINFELRAFLWRLKNISRHLYANQIRLILIIATIKSFKVELLMFAIKSYPSGKKTLNVMF
jgi:hypothetical protein